MAITYRASWGLPLCHWLSALSPRNVNEAAGPAATLSVSGPLSILLSLSPDHTAWQTVFQNNLCEARSRNEQRQVCCWAALQKRGNGEQTVGHGDGNGRMGRRQWATSYRLSNTPLANTAGIKRAWRGNDIAGLRQRRRNTKPASHNYVCAPPKQRPDLRLVWAEVGWL